MNKFAEIEFLDIKQNEAFIGLIEKVVNACFKEEKLQIKCFGESLTLAIKSNPNEDKEIIKNFIANKYWTPSLYFY